MRPFDWFAMVDWSAANDTGPRPRKDAIWIGMAGDGSETEPVYCRNRHEAGEEMQRLIEHASGCNKRLLMAFDFPFGYPAGFATKVVGMPDPLDLWAFFHKELRDTPDRNNRFELAGRLNGLFPGVGPFWFNGSKIDVADLPRKGTDRHGHGMPERREVERRTKGTFTCWQMGGAGAVGGQVMTGMAALHHLRTKYADRVAVWPFEPLDKPVAFVEAWPGVIADVVAEVSDPIRDRAQVRLTARALARLPQRELDVMLDVDAPEEGWIFGVNHEENLRRALCRS